jgi:hypothetical protein
MPIFSDQYPLQLLAQARTALAAYFAKKGLKGAELVDKVNRVMKVQFGTQDKQK